MEYKRLVEVMKLYLNIVELQRLLNIEFVINLTVRIV